MRGGRGGTHCADEPLPPTHRAVGFHGRDVDSIIKDLLDVALGLVRELRGEQQRADAAPAVEARLIEALTGPGAAPDTVESFRGLLRAGALEAHEVTVEVPATAAAKKGADAAGDLGPPAAAGGGALVGLNVSGGGFSGDAVDMTDM